jgi:hypothetical protein
MSDVGAWVADELPWKVNKPIVRIEKACYRQSPGPKAAALGSTVYVGPKLERMEWQGVERLDDVWDEQMARWSIDNGRTWTAWAKMQPSSNVSYAGITVWEGSVCRAYDPAAERLVDLWLRQIQLDGRYNCFTYYRTSQDFGRTWTEPKQLCYEAGDPFDPEQPLKPSFLTKNQGYPANSLLPMRDGSLVAFVCHANAPHDAENERRAWRLASLCFVGRWDAGIEDYQWRAGRRVEISGDLTTRGLMEPEPAQLTDGRVLVVWRGSDTPQTPGRKWYAVSHDGGLTLSDVREWKYDDGSAFYSPSSYHRMFRHTVTNKLYWVGNICANPPSGNSPRYPLVIAEVDETIPALKKKTVSVVDDRQADQPAAIQFSNFSFLEDRETHRIEMQLTTYGQDSASVYTADNWKYFVTLLDDIDLGGVTERHEMIPMRDGQRLSAYLYFPVGDGPWPVLFEQRYADLRGAGTRQAAAKLAQAGFVVALVNFRGTYQSEGTWVGYRALGWGALQDGYDTCEWLATRSWCTGKVGTFGSSQGGYAQNFLAVAAAPHLTCQYMVDTGLSLFHEGYRIGGTTRPERFKRIGDVCRDRGDNRALMAEWFRHPHYDDYWRQEDCSLHFDRMDVPCCTIGSWYDFMNQGSIASFIGRQHHGGPNSRGRQQLIVGPWLHGRLNKGNHVGQLVYPENAAWPEYEHMVRWFNHYLKGEDNGIEADPPVRYYVMGAVGEPQSTGSVWRTASDWPPTVTTTPLYLHAAGGLAVAAPEIESSSTSFCSDPLHPMTIPGTSFPGAQDARSFEQQPEVRTFTTEPLTEPIEWTGRVRAELLVSSTARDTDFIVRVSDVYPDGRSILIIDYPWRARYRDGFDHEVLLEPGKITKLSFHVGWLSQLFAVGHRIRITIASTGAPLYEPNPQTGEPLTMEFTEAAVIATNTIHHGRQHASRILAPVVTSAPAGEGVRGRTATVTP